MADASSIRTAANGPPLETPALVMVVDDEQAVLNVLAAALELTGIKALSCPDPLQALELAEQRRPDLFLIDLMMPKLHGIELCRRLRARPEHENAIVILMTGKADPNERSLEIVRGLEAGANDYLTKPFDVVEVIARARAWLRMKSSHDRLASAARSAEGALIRSEDKYRTVLEQASDGIGITDGEGRLLEANPRLCQMLDRPQQELLGLTIRELIAPDDLAAPPPLPLAELRQGKAVMTEHKLLRRDGTPLWTEVSAKQIEDGRLLAIFRDITERKRAEDEQRRYAQRLEAEVAERTQEIRASEEKHRALFENVDHAIVTTDCSGLIQSCNRTTARIFGVSSEDILGRPVHEVFCGEEGIQVFENLLATVLKSGTCTHECTARDGQGRELPVNLSISALRDSQGRPEGMIWIITDLSERERLEEEAQRAHEYADIVLRTSGSYGELVGGGAGFRKITRFVGNAAGVPSPVLLQGESGTGKEAVARAIHGNSPRSGEPFVVVDCAALKGSLLESELFGHEKGAFTGAHQTKNGLVEVASGGTLFLDEIGDMPVGLQAKLLRVLERGEFRRVGSVKDRTTDIRVIAATNRDLVAESQEGRFRKDLFFRLNVLSFTVPLLHERQEDIPLLARHFLTNSRITLTGKKRLRQDTLRQLAAYDWPGNVRELANVVERAIILSGEDPVLKPAHLPPEVRSARGDLPPPAAGVKTVAEAEREAVRAAMAHTGGNKTRAARLLGISTVTLRQKIKKYDLDAAGKRPR